MKKALAISFSLLGSVGIHILFIMALSETILEKIVAIIA
jgi:hypothetical protein